MLQDLLTDIRIAEEYCDEYGIVSLTIETLQEWENIIIDIIEGESNADTEVDI